MRETQPEPIRDALSATEAFDESRPIPESALAALAYMNSTALTIARYESALRRIAHADYRGNRSPLSQIALEALHSEPRPCRSGPGCHNAEFDRPCCVERGMEPS